MDAPLTRLASLRATADQVIAEATVFLRNAGESAPATPTERAVRLVLFGTYNAGKSTLVNALMGSAVASVGAAPETRVARVIEHEGYDVVDLPGLDARDAEASSAYAALDDADVALVVIGSAGAGDTGALWQAVSRLDDARKPWILVVNDMHPSQTAQEAREKRDTILRGVRKAAAQGLKSQDKALVIHWVNAKVAFDARISAQEKLLNASGLVPLEHALLALVQRSAPVLSQLRQLDLVRKRLLIARSSVAAACEDPAITDAEATLKTCETLRKQLIDCAEVIAEERYASLADLVATALRRSAEGAVQRSEAQADVEALFQRTFDAATEQFAAKANLLLGQLSSKLGESATIGRAGHPEGGVNVGSVPEGSVRKEFNPLEAIAAAMAAVPVVRGLETAVLAGAEGQVDKILRGMGRSTKIARNTRVAGNIAIVAVAAFDVYRGFHRYGEEQKAHEGMVKQAHEQSKNAASMAKARFLSVAASAVVEVLNPIQASANDRLEEGRASSAHVVAQLRRAEGLVARVDASILDIQAEC
jgi:hypothetical protein